MRADRLIQALLLLQGRPQITAAQLADELGERMARQYADGLDAASAPIG